MGRLELKGIGKRFGKARALHAVDLQVEPGQVVGLTGPSGAGKTTTCRIIAGIESALEGEVRIGGSPVDSLSPERRGVAFMFESYALYPHLTVFDNIAFPLRAPNAKRRCSTEEIARQVFEQLQLVQMEGLERRFPSELSGGQKQRVALCRALVQEPSVYLLDEPISHLDAKLRHTLRGEIRRRLIQTAVPTLWTSPDALEALAVADRVAVLVKGEIQQVGTPQEVYRHPANVEVARLVGDPAMNLLTGTLAWENQMLLFRHSALSLPLGETLRAKLEANGKAEKIILGVRPTGIRVVDGGPEGAGHVGEVYVYEPFGKYGILSVRLGQDVVKVKISRARSYEPGDAVRLDFGEADLVVFDAALGQAI